eukprot:1155550-Pelagomonas_calceolata.AAC.1
MPRSSNTVNRVNNFKALISLSTAHSVQYAQKLTSSGCAIENTRHNSGCAIENTRHNSGCAIENTHNSGCAIENTRHNSGALGLHVSRNPPDPH